MMTSYKEQNANTLNLSLIHIYSPTGAYSGYGFAIPTSIMTKVVADLKQFGTVQRALLGLSLIHI